MAHKKSTGPRRAPGSLPARRKPTRATTPEGRTSPTSKLRARRARQFADLAKKIERGELSGRPPPSPPSSGACEPPTPPLDRDHLHRHYVAPIRSLAAQWTQIVGRPEFADDYAALLATTRALFALDRAWDNAQMSRSADGVDFLEQIDTIAGVYLRKLGRDVIRPRPRIAEDWLDMFCRAMREPYFVLDANSRVAPVDATVEPEATVDLFKLRDPSDEEIRRAAEHLAHTLVTAVERGWWYGDLRRELGRNAAFGTKTRVDVATTIAKGIVDLDPGADWRTPAPTARKGAARTVRACLKIMELPAPRIRSFFDAIRKGRKDSP